MTQFDRDWGASQKSRLHDELGDHRDQQLRNQGVAGGFLMGAACVLFWLGFFWMLGA